MSTKKHKQDIVITVSGLPLSGKSDIMAMIAGFLMKELHINVRSFYDPERGADLRLLERYLEDPVAFKENYLKTQSNATTVAHLQETQLAREEFPQIPSIPSNPVILSRHPLNWLGSPCDFDGDIDRFGRMVAYTDGQWKAWYSFPNEPFFPEDTSETE